MKLNVGILIFDNAEVLDFAGPFEVFSVTSQLNDFELYNTFTVAKNDSIISAVNGLLIKPTYNFENHPRIDILIIAGGQGTNQVIENKQVMGWVFKVHQTTKITASICSGARLLGKLGLLDGKPFCTHHQVYDSMSKIAPKAVAKKAKRFIQSDEKIYTSGGISAGIDLSFYLVEKEYGAAVTKKTAKYMEYNHQSKNK